MVASKAMAADPRAEPLFSERVPFVVRALALSCWLAWSQLPCGVTHAAAIAAYQGPAVVHVAYQVVYGEPGSRLVDQAVGPRELVESQGALRLNATYYILKQV